MSGTVNYRILALPREIVLAECQTLLLLRRRLALVRRALKNTVRVEVKDDAGGWRELDPRALGPPAPPTSTASPPSARRAPG
jgi:hypothetical protein